MATNLAGYLSGSAVEFARVSEQRGQIRLAGYQRFNARDFSDFESVLGLYLRRSKATISQACFGVAGPVIGHKVRMTSLDWLIDSTLIEQRFEMERVKLINDMVATAHGLSELDSEQFFTINKGHPSAAGNLGLIAAGNGLGEALIYADSGQFYPYASEGGHGDFAPSSQVEAELWEYLYPERGQVEVEDVVSLRGLTNIFNFFAEVHGGTKEPWYYDTDDLAGAIIEKALSGKDTTASKALDLFIDCYASEAANLALKGMTIGGIFIGGLIVPRIITALDKARFMQRFVKKGKMEKMLSRIPVGVVIEGKTSLLGAARVVMGRHKK